jgi:hypothetical protein
VRPRGHGARVWHPASSLERVNDRASRQVCTGSVRAGARRASRSVWLVTARTYAWHTSCSARVGQTTSLSPRRWAGRQVALWMKFLSITPSSGIGALTHAPIGIWRRLPETRRMSEQAVHEVLAVAQPRCTRRWRSRTVCRRRSPSPCSKI